MDNLETTFYKIFPIMVQGRVYNETHTWEVWKMDENKSHYSPEAARFLGRHEILSVLLVYSWEIPRFVFQTEILGVSSHSIPSHIQVFRWLPKTILCLDLILTNICSFFLVIQLGIGKTFFCIWFSAHPTHPGIFLKREKLCVTHLTISLLLVYFLLPSLLGRKDLSCYLLHIVYYLAQY